MSILKAELNQSGSLDVHERTIARSVLRNVDQLASKHASTRVVGIKLLVGEFSGVDAELLRIALQDSLAEQGRFMSHIEISLTPLLAKCGACQHQFHVVRFQFECPSCQRRDVKIERGEDLVLESITLTSDNL